MSKAYVEETDDRHQKHRIQVRREQPFRSASTDVGQVCNRCNVDYQFLPCAPSEATTEHPGDALQSGASEAGGASQPAAAVSGASQPAEAAPARRRIRGKTAPQRQRPRKLVPECKWCYGVSRLAARVAQTLRSFADAFRKAMAMDFYITKYQGKMMEALTPLFQTMLGDIQRLQQQEQQEDEES